MTTTKETMKIIAMGLGETGARELEDCSDCPLVDALSYCIIEVPDACDAFADSFFDDGYVDWYCVEGWLRDMFPSKNQKLLS